MQIAILLYDGFTPLDVVGPYEVLARTPGVTVSCVASDVGPVETDAGLSIVADTPLRALQKPEIVVVPGGLGAGSAASDREVIGWITSAHANTTWTTSVCTGALILGAAGLLRGVRATTHWNHVHRLEAYGAIPTEQRVVRDGKIVTAAGVSAGIDMGLQLVQILKGDVVAQAVQLSMEYDPHPPFDSGAPAKAAPDIVEFVRSATRTASEAWRGMSNRVHR
ncbi:MAG: DJ-1/PfpI family protein [Myxococcota bacterium]